MTSTNNQNAISELNEGFEEIKKTKDILGKNIDLSFKPIHQQVQEENEKTQKLANRGSKSMFPDLEIDENLLNLLMPSDTFNEDDFDYFQHFGSRRYEPTHAPHNQTKDDIKKFKDLRSKVIVKEDAKEPEVFLAKKSEKGETKKLNVLKVKTKSKDGNQELVKESTNIKNDGIVEKTADNNKRVVSQFALVDYSSGEDGVTEESGGKKLKVDQPK